MRKLSRRQTKNVEITKNKVYTKLLETGSLLLSKMNRF